MPSPLPVSRRSSLAVVLLAFFILAFTFVLATPLIPWTTSRPYTLARPAANTWDPPAMRSTEEASTAIPVIAKFASERPGSAYLRSLGVIASLTRTALAVTAQPASVSLLKSTNVVMAPTTATTATAQFAFITARTGKTNASVAASASPSSPAPAPKTVIARKATASTTSAAEVLKESMQSATWMRSASSVL
ncbi:hypothetical protein A4X09_0g6978 [Tilletia walkeri]|uniref:Uncharacterized protein n=1 Tax=Tilletia walkeri TaxID=117179 RepID=A0A8X7N1N3_9BASI|nr:hypothetical protein A4X09_0g6978 [Tilletia walkeri]